MTITLEELLASGHPQIVIAAIEQHPDLKEDRTFNRLFISLKGDVNRYAADLAVGTSSTEKAALRSRQLMARIEQLVDYQSIYDFAVEKGSLPKVKSPTGKAEALKVLFLASNPGGLLQLDREWRGVSMALQDKKDKFDLNSSNQVTKEKVRSALLRHQPQLVHFSGHGIAEGNSFRQAGLIFQAPDSANKSETMSAEDAAAMFELIHQAFPLTLVLLNACESSEHARLISIGGFHAIGMTVEIEDSKATAFAQGFYEGLAATPDNIPYAFQHGVDWLPKPDRGVPKLYLNGEEVTQ